MGVWDHPGISELNLSAACESTRNFFYGKIICMEVEIG